jgi:transposase
MFIMVTIERKLRRRRSVMPELKAEIVERCRPGDRTIGQVTRDSYLAETDASDRPGPAQRRAGGAGAVARENRSLRKDVEVRKRATLFAKETR